MEKKAHPDATPIGVPDFFMQFLKTKLGADQVVIEWGYNIADACKRFARDADVEIFFLCLFEELPEAAYHGQMAMISELIERCQKIDREQHGGRATSNVERKVFLKLLRTLFPFKSDEDVKSLQRALSYDQPLPQVNYAKLFESDRDANQGHFAETLRDQYVSAAQSLYPQVEQELRHVLAQHADASMPETSQLKLKDHHRYCKMLRDRPFFAAFTEMETEKILATAEVAEFSAGQRIIAEGSEAHWLFLLVEGSAVATLDMAPKYEKIYRSVGDFFGEQAMLTHGRFVPGSIRDVRRHATVTAGKEGATCLLIRGTMGVEEQLIARNGELFDEAMMSYHALEQKVLELHPTGHADGEGMDSGHKLITVAQVKLGLRAFDKLMPAAEMDRICSVGYDVTQGSPLSEKATVELGVFMSRLKTIIIPRFSKPKYVEDEEGEHHRPLPSACIFVFRVQLLNLRSCCQSTLRIPLQRSEEVPAPAFSRCRASFAPH